MANPFVESLAVGFERSLGLLEAAVADCPDALWETDLWPDEAPTGPSPHGGLHGSAPWFLAYHALTVVDYDLAAGDESWRPPAPFTDNTWSFPNRVFTRDEVLGYVSYYRARARTALDGLTQAVAAQPLPATHRFAGLPHVVNVGALPLHTVEHAAQIRQFLSSSGVKVRPMPGDRDHAGA